MSPAAAPSSPRPRRRFWRWVGIALALVVVALLGAGLWLRSRLVASLPQLDGEQRVNGPSAAVELLRDARGLLTVRAASRADAAYGLGFVHAQERFFQMDLQRRDGAGELAELIGPAVVKQDLAHRVHRFRRVATAAYEAAGAEEKALVDAYAAGVNAGLESLGAPPFEYLALGGAPRAWEPVDSYLTVHAMFFVLQDEDADDEAARALLDAHLPPALAAFLQPYGTSWDSPLAGGPAPEVPLPTAEEVDLRAAPTTTGEAGPRKAADDVQEIGGTPGVGSNNFAVGPARTADGRAIVANDPHLGFQVPNIWYRARLEWRDERGEHAVTGVTLPGVPLVVIGSNGRVAWGFTNSYVDTTDLVIVEPDPADPSRYLTPEGPRPIETVREMVAVKGEAARPLDIRTTIWGPILRQDPSGRDLAVRWVAHEPAAAGFLPEIETGESVAAMLEVASRAGVPAQNLTMADAEGHVGWTLIGKVARRVGFDGRHPTSWADGTRHWDGFLDATDAPRVIDPEDGVLWTANSRVTPWEEAAKVGDGGYDVGARARQIRDELRALAGAREADLQAIQLDDRALFLGRWRDLLLDVLASEPTAADPPERRARLAELRRVVDGGWTGHAAVESAAYRLVRAFRLRCQETIFEALTEPLKKADEQFRWWHLQHREAPLWTLVSERPTHLLPAGLAATWEELLVRVADDVAVEMTTACGDLASCTWGRRNTLAMRHPLSLAVPALGRFLDMPAQPLPGDEHMPRVQSPTFGASMRMVVAPGREAEGLLHMPGGQSGHPLSPFYHRGHEEWVEGRPAPFLPGATVHRLRLVPG